MRTIILVAAALLLAGCESDGASFLVNGNSLAVSVVRHKAYPGAPWELALVVRNDPVCQRKHRMKDVSGTTKVELYQPSPGAWILRQGKRWYVAELKTCGFEQFKEEPQQPGDLIGTFVVRDGTFRYESETKDDGKARPGAAPAKGG